MRPLKDIVISSLFALLSTVFFSSTAIAQVRSRATEQIQDTKVAYVALYPDKTKEKILVSYEAFVSHVIWQTGRGVSLDPRDFHPRDTRKCHVDIKSWVQRRAYIVSYSGVPAPLDQYADVYARNKYVDRGADKPWEFHHVTCGQVMQAFLGYVRGTKAKLNAAFPVIITGDNDITREKLKAMLQATELTKK